MFYQLQESCFVFVLNIDPTCDLRLKTKKWERKHSEDVFILQRRERKTERQTGNKGMQRERERGKEDAYRNRQSMTNIFILLWEREKVVRGRERNKKINIMDRGASETETQKLLKPETKTTLIGRVSQWRWMKDGGGGGGGGDTPAVWAVREGSSTRKQDSIKLCQGQFAVNGPLHLVALSLRACMLLGASLHCMLGGHVPL